MLAPSSAAAGAFSHSAHTVTASQVLLDTTYSIAVSGQVVSDRMHWATQVNLAPPSNCYTYGCRLFRAIADALVVTNKHLAPTNIYIYIYILVLA